MTPALLFEYIMSVGLALIILAAIALFVYANFFNND